MSILLDQHPPGIWVINTEYAPESPVAEVVIKGDIPRAEGSGSKMIVNYDEDIFRLYVPFEKMLIDIAWGNGYDPIMFGGEGKKVSIPSEDDHCLEWFSE
jgi:hypothetical protein